MTATHTIKSTTENFLNIREIDDGTLYLSAHSPKTGDGAGVILPDGRRIALAFAAIGGGTIEPTKLSEHLGDMIGHPDSALTDDDLILVARKALRVLANRRKKRVSQDRHVDAVLTAVHSLGLVLNRANAKALVAAGVQVVK